MTGRWCRCGHAQHPGQCSCGCEKFRRDRRRERVVALGDEPPQVAIRLFDARRDRSQKTARANARGTYGVGPSDLGTCRKQIEYRERPPDDYVPGEVDRAAAYLGTMIHEGITQARRWRYRHRRFKVPVALPGVPEPGEADEYDPILGRVTDYKTTSETAWDWLGRYGPSEDTWDQVYVYGYGLEEAGLPVREVELLYWNRNDGTTEPFRRPYSRARALAALAKLHAVLDALEGGASLPRDRPGPTLDKLCARHCPAVAHCWQTEAAAAAGRTPEGWMLARDDETVATLLGEYLAAHEAAKPFNAVKEQVKVLVDGVEPGRYGNATLRWTGGKPRWVPDLAARVRQLEEALGRVAPDVLADLDPPQRRETTSTRIEIRPVRAAEIAAQADVQAGPVEGVAS